MIGMRADKAAYFLADATLPFYVEFEFDAAALAAVLARSGLDAAAFKQELLRLKMFAVRRGLEAQVEASRAQALWGLYLKHMERILDMLFPRHKEAFKAGLDAALADYAASCPGVDESLAASAGAHLARRLGLECEPRLAAYAANAFGRKADRLARILSRRIRF